MTREQEELLNYLSNKIVEEIEMYKADITRGTAKDFAEYKHVCGTVAGLTKSYYIIKETIERMKTDE